MPGRAADLAQAETAATGSVAATEVKPAAARELSWVVDHIQLHIFLTVFRYANGMTSRFVQADELGVLPRARFDVLPGEKLVITGRNLLECKLPVAACDDRLIESRSFPRICRNENDRDIRCRLSGARQ